MITSNLPLMTKNLTCAVTGHRVIEKDFDFEKLKSDLAGIIEEGYSIFLTGMAQGFDTLCFKALISLKENYPFIKICAVIPCADQNKYFNSVDKEAYNLLIEQADFLAKEDRTYFKGCMLIRNNFLIDNCSLLYAYWNKEKRGGTYYTVKRAMEKTTKVKFYGEEQ